MKKFQGSRPEGKKAKLHKVTSKLYKKYKRIARHENVDSERLSGKPEKGPRAKADRFKRDRERAAEARQEQERARRDMDRAEAAKKRKEAERKRRFREHTRRTRKGQPVLRGQITGLLERLSAEEGAGAPAAGRR